MLSEELANGLKDVLNGLKVTTTSLSATSKTTYYWKIVARDSNGNTSQSQVSTIGFSPNMMVTFAQSPIAFNTWVTLFGSLSKALDVKTSDSIGLAVSEGNGYNYCLTVHSLRPSIWPSCRPMKSFSPERAMPAIRSGTPM
jgi:hypothetical protein